MDSFGHVGFIFLLIHGFIYVLYSLLIFLIFDDDFYHAFHLFLSGMIAGLPPHAQVLKIIQLRMKQIRESMISTFRTKPITKVLERIYFLLIMSLDIWSSCLTLFCNISHPRQLHFVQLVACIKVQLSFSHLLIVYVCISLQHCNMYDIILCHRVLVRSDPFLLSTLTVWFFIIKCFACPFLGTLW